MLPFTSNHWGWRIYMRVCKHKGVLDGQESWNFILRSICGQGIPHSGGHEAAFGSFSIPWLAGVGGLTQTRLKTCVCASQELCYHCWKASF